MFFVVLYVGVELLLGDLPATAVELADVQGIKLVEIFKGILLFNANFLL